MSTDAARYLPRTWNALKNIENIITCSSCKQTALNPCTLGSCEHIFCRHCCQSYLGGTCPVCDIPAPAKDAQVNRQLFNIVTLCQKLHNVLSDNKNKYTGKNVTDDEDIQVCCEDGRNLPVNTSFTYSLSIANKDEINESIKLKENKQQVPETNYQDNSPPKTKKKRVSRKSFTATKSLTSLSEVKAQDAEITANIDQTTMTQFFDYVVDVGTSEPTPFHSNENKKVNSFKSKAVSSLAKENLKKPELMDKVLRTRTSENRSKKEEMFRRSQKRRSSGMLLEEGLSTPLKQKNAVLRQAGAGKKSACVSPTAALRSENKSLRKTCLSKTSSTKKIQTDPLFKKNAKGETPLQIVAIKGDVDKTKELLKAGANPNTRDNAGWTPLHEAVHHGNLEIAKLLLDHGALVDVPGVDNDTPLHDAVCNYKVECVKLLVSYGASLTARNIFGLTPQDYATSLEMKSALKTNVTASIPKIQCVDVLEYQKPCLLGTFLNRDQKIMLQKCAILLQAKVVEEFSPEVTHIILPCNKDGMCPRTIKYLLGVLTGKWIVSIEWVQMCIDYRSRVNEEAFEIPGTSNNPDSNAAHKGRINRIKQLPRLFDGCQFYFHGDFKLPSPEKEELIDIVRTGGGYLLTREPRQNNLDENTFTTLYHADPDGPLALCCIYVVHDVTSNFPNIHTARMCTVTPSWILNSVGLFKLLDPS